MPLWALCLGSNPWLAAMALLQRTVSSAVVQSVAMASCAAASGTLPSQTSSCSLDSTPSFGFGDAPGSIHRLRDVATRLPAQLTSFVGRDAQLTQLRELLGQNRLVTLTGAGGVGKTRLAIQVAAQMAGEFGDGVWYVDLAPITDPELVPVTVARALGLPDQPGRSTMDSLLRFVRDRQLLVVLDMHQRHMLRIQAGQFRILPGAQA